MKARGRHLVSAEPPVRKSGRHDRLLKFRILVLRPGATAFLKVVQRTQPVGHRQVSGDALVLGELVRHPRRLPNLAFLSVALHAWPADSAEPKRLGAGRAGCGIHPDGSFLDLAHDHR